MDHFDDIQIEEFYPSDFVEDVYNELFDEDEDERNFYRYLKSNTDY
jgi:hypothetical protein